MILVVVVGDLFEKAQPILSLGRTGKYEADLVIFRAFACSSWVDVGHIFREGEGKA